MSRTKKSILLIFAGLLAFGTVSIIATDVLKATTPTGVTMTLLKSELMTDAAAAPVTVVDKTADGGSPINIVTDPNKVFGSGTNIPVGTYKWLKLTVKNQISFAVADADKCPSDTQTSQTFLIKSGEAADAAVVLYFAYGADSYSYWPSGLTTSDPFMMEHPLVVEAGKTTDVKIIFKMNDAVYCNSDKQSAMAPLVTDVVSSIIDADPPSDCTFAGAFWWVDYNMYGGSVKSADGSIVIDPSLDQIMRRAGLNVGWGSIIFNNDGTWQVEQGLTVSEGGMAEHHHGLANFGGAEAGYNDPAYEGATVITGNYTLSGSRIIMSMDDWYAEGAFTDDCSMFLVVNSSASDNNLIYGIKKLTAAPNYSSSDTYVSVGPELGLAFSSPTTTADVTYIGYHNHFSASNATLYFEWKTLSDYMPVRNSGVIESFMTWGAQEMTNIGAGGGGSYNSDGFVPMDEDFGAIGANGEMIMAGRMPFSDITGTLISDVTNTGTHGMSTGYSIPVLANPVVSDLTGTWSIAVLQSTVDAGPDNSWGTSNEGVSFGLSFGEIELGSDGAVLSVHIFDKNLLTGEVTLAPFSATSLTGPHTECYKPGLLLSDSTCSGGVTVPVFYLVTATDTIEAKLALAKNKKTLVFWSPIDVNDTPEGTMGTATCGFGAATAVDCSNQGQPHALNGVGIKIK